MTDLLVMLLEMEEIQTVRSLRERRGSERNRPWSPQKVPALFWAPGSHSCERAMV